MGERRWNVGEMWIRDDERWWDLNERWREMVIGAWEMVRGGERWWDGEMRMWDGEMCVQYGWDMSDIWVRDCEMWMRCGWYMGGIWIDRRWAKDDERWWDCKMAIVNSMEKYWTLFVHIYSNIFKHSSDISCTLSCYNLCNLTVIY